ncbi:MAG: response regulator receiver protein [Thermoleophilia bacterium]|nr:response regulator receiver protein [Thermoleophilia bacterium]
MDEHRPITVVTVDDTDAIRTLLKLVIELEPDMAVVGQASDGRRGVEMVAEHAPDVVLLDIAMPEMDGITALPLIREASPASRVVMLSGFGTDEIRRRCRDLGAVSFLDKGIIATSIVAEIRRAAQLDPVVGG